MYLNLQYTFDYFPANSSTFKCYVTLAIVNLIQTSHK